MMETIMDTVINISLDDFYYVLTLVYKNLTSSIDTIIDQIQDELENSHLMMNGINGRTRLYYEKYQTLRGYLNTSVTISNMLLDSEIYHNHIDRRIIVIQSGEINRLAYDLVNRGYLEYR